MPVETPLGDPEANDGLAWASLTGPVLTLTPPSPQQVPATYTVKGDLVDIT